MPLNISVQIRCSDVNLLQAHTECVERAKELLRMPPVLPERKSKGAAIEKDEKLDKAIQHRFVFTDTTQHMDDKVLHVIKYLCMFHICSVSFCRTVG